MKRINILLNRKNVLYSVALLFGFPIGMSLYIYLLCGMFGEPLEHWFIPEMLLFALMGLLIILLPCMYLPLYLEYDDEKIIAHYLFGIKAKVWRNKPIYTAKQQLGKAGYNLLFSNEPFAVYSLNFTNSVTSEDFYFSGKLNRKTQITLPSNADAALLSLFPAKMCIPAQKADWATLIKQHKDKPANCSTNRKVRLLPIPWTDLALTTYSFLFFAVMIWLASIEESTLGYYALFVCCYVAFPWLVIVFSTKEQIKLLRVFSTIYIGEHTVETHFMRNTLCTVDLNETVYYAVFRSREFGTSNTPYIVVSNDWFNYYVVNRPDRSYLSEYPLDTQVAFPYNAETAAICDFDNWHCVGGFGELNMKRSKTP